MTDAIENLCPVSVLAVGLAGTDPLFKNQPSSSASPVDRASGGHRESIAVPLVLNSLAAGPSTDSPHVVRPHSQTVLAALAVPAPEQTSSRLPGLAAQPADASAASIITVSPALRPSPSPTGGVMGQSNPRGSNGVSSPPPPVKVETPARPPADADGIRALVLTPTSSPKASLSTPSSGGSGGGPPADKPPVLLVASGGGWGGSFETSPGHYVDPFTVPVGALVTVQTASPAAGYDVASVTTWAGGTDFKSYFAQDGGDKPNVPQTIVTGVPTNQLTYTFIADTNPRDYTITANVVYTNGARGTSDMTFTTQKPSASLAVFSQGSTKVYAPPNPAAGLGAAVQYDNWGPPNPSFPANAGIEDRSDDKCLGDW